jgi:hypothetical protein
VGTKALYCSSSIISGFGLAGFLVSGIPCLRCTTLFENGCDRGGLRFSSGSWKHTCFGALPSVIRCGIPTVISRISFLTGVFSDCYLAFCHANCCSRSCCCFTFWNMMHLHCVEVCGFVCCVRAFATVVTDCAGTFILTTSSFASRWPDVGCPQHLLFSGIGMAFTPVTGGFWGICRRVQVCLTCFGMVHLIAVANCQSAVAALQVVLCLVVGCFGWRMGQWTVVHF